LGAGGGEGEREKVKDVFREGARRVEHVRVTLRFLSESSASSSGWLEGSATARVYVYDVVYL